MSLPVSILAVTVAFVATCWLTDVKTRQIPNLLSGSALIVGLILNLAFFGRWGLMNSVAGAFVAFCVLIGPFALGGIGGGDVKMMGAIGALLGPLLVLNALAVGLILGGVVMMVHLAGLGRLREKLMSTLRMFMGAWSEKSLVPLRLSDEDVAAVTLPYSVPLGLGTVAVLLPRVGMLGPLF
jgi:prepilin peptidase CpaA